METEGIIVRIEDRGWKHPTLITVEYCVDEETYWIKEPVCQRSEPIKIGFLSIGKRKIPVMGDVKVGTEVLVIYGPNCPSMGQVKLNAKEKR